MLSLSNHFNVNQLKIFYLIKTIYVFSQHSLKTTLRRCPQQLQFYLEKGGLEGKINARTQLLFYNVVYQKCYLVLYLNSKKKGAKIKLDLCASCAMS